MNGWTIRKEFYADGPSMFVWVAERPGERDEFPRRRDALAHARTHARQNHVDRCYCGCKYWEHDRCIDCGGTAPEPS